MKRTAHIIYDNFLLPDGSGMSLGGIQTYLKNLSRVLNDVGYYVIIYQRGDFDFHKNISDYLEVYAVARPIDKVKGLKELLYEFAAKKINSSNGDILIFGSDTAIVKNALAVKTIAIQHGISWDVPINCISRGQYALEYLKKQYRAYRLSNEIKFVTHLICVDCNFINWYKALVPFPQMKLHYIPNFSAIPETTYNKPSTKEGVNIIFARRFFPKRGTRLFMNVAKRILSERNNVHITLAGEGPDEMLLKENLGRYSNVEFKRYQSQDSLLIHKQQHIAVIPTLGSEGTSLSLLEAMASECAVVCTNVGGMTNIVINEYNGLMINPEENELYIALLKLIDDDSFRGRIAKMGAETVKNAFSLSQWETSWKKVLNNI